jgi:hypothetical protein
MQRVDRRLVSARLLLAAFFIVAAVGRGPDLVAGQGSDQAAASPDALARIWDAEHVSPPLPPLLRHAEVERRVREVEKAAPDLFSLEEIGRSVEGRSLYHLWFGRGPLHVLLWSQMHGDEPTATAALFDVYEYVWRHRREPQVTRLLDGLTIHTVPMLNPDGAERFQRRNAQGIDINRDALLLQSPEGLALKALRDRLQPSLGFNLHNQNWRTSVGKTGKPATISLLAVAFDEARSDNPGRILAKRICAVIRDALEPLAPGQIARYDDEFEVRAFGDNLTRWGTPIVLVETGAFAGLQPDAALVRLNFVAIISALDALASGRATRADPSRYESLPMNDSGLFYQLVRNATIAPGTGVTPFKGDVGVVISRKVVQEGGTLRLRATTRIDDLGDLRVFGALETIEADGAMLVPLLSPIARVGDMIPLSREFFERPMRGGTIQVGEPAQLMLLKPSGQADSYRVEKVIRSEWSY